MSGKSRIEKILENLLGENNVIEPPIGRDEKILYSILNDLEYTEPPHSIFEELLLAIKNSSPLETEYAYDYLTRDEKILFCKLNRLEYFEPPHSRLEKLLIKWLYLDLYLNIDGVPPFTFISNGSPLIDYLISGNTVQTGTPTPDSPIMPQGTGERTAQLFDKDNTTLYNLLPGTDNTIRVSSNARSIAIPCVGGETYTVSKKAGQRFMVCFTTEPIATQVTYTELTTNNTATSITVVAPLEAKYLFVYFYNSTADVDTVETLVNSIMINTGSPALPYDKFGIKIPILSADTTTPVYLGEVETTRRIKKLVLTGQEVLVYEAAYTRFKLTLTDMMFLGIRTTPILCSHYITIDDGRALSNIPNNAIYVGGAAGAAQIAIKTDEYNTESGFKGYLAQQYAAGTPITVWYVLATEETAIVNEPLMKIGNYADTLSMEQAGVEIPTASGRNTFDVLGDVKPSNVELTYAPRAPLLRTRKTILKK